MPATGRAVRYTKGEHLMATVHLQADQPGSPACPVDEAETVPLDEALSADGPTIDCVACHQLLTGGLRHSTPEEDR